MSDFSREFEKTLELIAGCSCWERRYKELYEVALVLKSKELSEAEILDVLQRTVGAAYVPIGEE